ncbi:orotidine-5'-phosphate decarboxylase [Candidatus Kaiserbacteria bacterium]|nr:orotidine-5'-phosphate decarboxylase [Candidatus Kaiserbacteria bacterium]
MTDRDFWELVRAKWRENKFLCVGLDPDFEKIPEGARVGGVRESFMTFNRAIIDETKDIVCAYKPNSAFYEAHGDEGWQALRETIMYAREQAPDVPIIFDAKRADIGNTNNGYVAAAFDNLRADAITVHPYMGGESLKEFFARKEKGVFVMCRNSNHGAGEFQDLDVNGEPFYVYLARAFAQKWNKNGNCGLVVGATFPEEVRHVREVVPQMPILIPGTGAQGGDLASSVKNGKNAEGGFILSTSRAIIYASAEGDYRDVIRAKAKEFDAAIRAGL